MNVVFDRSRSEAFSKCPRLRFLQYEFPNAEGVNGLQRKAHAVPLLTGSMVHRALQKMLTATPIEGAIAGALFEYDYAIQERGIEEDELPPEPQWIAKVQRALIEALVRGWERVVWPRIQAEFDVLEVEREERATFQYGNDDELTLMARMDALLRRKADQQLFIRNFKTISDASERKIQSFRYDTQTISEVLATEQRIQQKISGVIYDLLVKGPKKVQYPRDSGAWHNTSPLIWCYFNESQSSTDLMALAAKWEYECPEPHQMGRGFCEGHRKHTLGKGWERKLVTDLLPGGVSEWLDWLAENESQLLRDQFVTLPAIERTEFDVQTWLQSVLPEEIRINASAEPLRKYIEQEGLLAALPMLNVTFPKHTANGNCVWPNRCPMHDICWGALSAVDKPEESELYMPREANHPEQAASDVLT